MPPRSFGKKTTCMPCSRRGKPGRTSSQSGPNAGLSDSVWHSKDYRPNLRQLVYELSVTRDGAIPCSLRVMISTGPMTHFTGKTGDAVRNPWPLGLPVCGRLETLRERNALEHRSQPRSVYHRGATHAERG